jgi:hypothetical protein
MRILGDCDCANTDVADSRMTVAATIAIFNEIFIWFLLDWPLSKHMTKISDDRPASMRARSGGGVLWRSLARFGELFLRKFVFSESACRDGGRI